MCDADENGKTGYGNLESLASDYPPEPSFLAKSGASDSILRVNLLLTAWGDGRILLNYHHYRMWKRGAGPTPGWLIVGDRGTGGRMRK